MRRTLVGLVALLSACSGATSATSTTLPEPTTSSAPSTSTTEPAAAVTSTSAPTTTTTLAPLIGLAYEPVASLPFPVQMTPWIDGLSLIATKDGQVWLYDGSRLAESAALDISDRVRNEGEQGLLSIAVHPDDTSRVFVHYSDVDGDTVVSEFSWDNESLVDEQVLFRLDQPARNHNGGMIQFGLDGFLYLGLGDGGGANDRYGNGQNTSTLLGGLIRLDVDDPDAEPVLYQYGLRNPWRFWIEDDLIYIADVGQNTWEEVDVAPLLPDVNYGWPVYEGTHCFSSGCEGEGWTFPLVEVEHGDAGTCSITGGVVYRGEAIPELDGLYFYSDYCGGYLRSFRYLFSGVADDLSDWTDQVGVAGRVVGFGVDGVGEMYVLTADGAILEVVPVR